MKYIIPLLLLYSCSTTNKHKEIRKSTIDSLSVVKIDSNHSKTVDSTNVKRDNTVTVKETEGNYTKETVIEFDNTKIASPLLTDSAIKKAWEDGKPYTTEIIAEDYFPVFLSRPVKKITIKETGIKKTKETTVADKNDSTNVKKTDSGNLTKDVKTNLVKTETVKKKEVERTSYWGWLWLLLLIPAYIVYRYWDKIKPYLKIV